MSILAAEHIVKKYPGTLALDDITVSFESGKVHAFVGKNGSGKSTLLKIFAGSEIKTEGKFYMDGKELDLHSPKDALEHGIATVYQELSLATNLSVMENIFLGRMPVRMGLVDWNEAKKKTREVLDELNLTDIKPTDIVGHLPAGKRQMIEIAKAMSFNPKVIQLDEPTASLAKDETEALFKVIRHLKTRNVIVIYVSHKLHELWKVCDTCTVLRDGKLIGKADLNALNNEDILHMMFGNVSIRTIPEDVKCTNEIVLRVNDLCSKRKFTHVSFELHKGEVLGIAGMLGSGRTELLSAIFGADPYDSGGVELFGKVMKKNPGTQYMKKKGLGMIQEDRQRQGIVQFHSIKQNMMRACIYKLGKGLFVNQKLEDELAEKRVKELQIKIAGLDNPITSLSGGNMQKVVVANWLNIEPKIMLLDEPSKGIDVNAKQQIFEIMWDMARDGISSVVVSTELEELIAICHRVLIIHDGKLRGEVSTKDLTVEHLYSLCMEEA